MSLLDKFNGLLADPPPEFGFELSEAGLAWADARNKGFLPFEPGTLRISPSEENILRPDSLNRAIREAVGEPNGKKRRSAALILPDYAGRTTVLDFDSFPEKSDEQNALLKFRLRKSVPFDIDSAAVSFQAQPRAGGKKIDVLASVFAYETLARYEAPFRAAGLQVGHITTSMLAALETVPPTGCRMMVKLSGLVLTMAVIDSGALRLMRTIQLIEATPAAIADHFLPTLTFLEDEWRQQPQSVYVIGFDPAWLDPDLPVEPLPAPLGQPTAANAGLLGWLAAGGRL